MSLWAIVPVKPLRSGKSRLAGVLSDEDRTGLNRALLTHTVTILQKVKGIEHVLVVSRDPEALALARDNGARTLREDGSPGLNVALARAAALVKSYAVSRILVVPADLPFMEPEDIEKMIELGSEPQTVVIVPDRRKDGTNALFLFPPDIIPFEYGPNSFNLHCEAARRIGARLVVFEDPSLELDVDYPEDLALVNGFLEFADLPGTNPSAVIAPSEMTSSAPEVRTPLEPVLLDPKQGERK